MAATVRIAQNMTVAIKIVKLFEYAYAWQMRPQIERALHVEALGAKWNLFLLFGLFVAMVGSNVVFSCMGCPHWDMELLTDLRAVFS